MLSGLILINKAPHYLLSVVELVEAVTEERRLLEVLDVRLAGFKFVELNAKGVENAPHASVVREHHSTDFVRCCYVRTLLSQCDLY